MSVEHLVKAAEAFEKIAGLPDFATICKNYGAAIQKEIAGGITSINRLITTNKKAANSHGIEVMDGVFGKLADITRELNPETFEISLRDIKSNIGRASFYASSTNAGTGYDPMTHEGGAYSPAAYLNRITTWVDKLEKWYNYSKGPVKDAPVKRHDPSLPSV